MTDARKGSWCAVWPKGKFWPQDVRVGDFRVESIAHALAMRARFAGHMKTWYSVAEHCVHVSRLVPPHLAREGLLHDATEFLMGDLVRPIKEADCMKGFRDTEGEWERVLAEQFGLVWPWPQEVKDADDAMLFCEKASLLPFSPPWSWGMRPVPVLLQYWDWETAEKAFLDRAAEIGLT